MRISDWSSDVCSSDLPSISEMALAGLAGLQRIEPKLSVVRGEERIRVVVGGQRIDSVQTPPEDDADAWGWTVARLQIGRASSRERCVKTYSIRWAPKY